jgi:hypothetical protein
MLEDLYKELGEEGFERVERDDRLLDVFFGHDREKGIELWDKWGDDTVEIIRLHIPKERKGMQKYVLSRESIEKALLEYQQLDLE